MSTIDQIMEQVAQLSENERFALANRLLSYGEPDESSEIEREWDLEIRERIARYDRGETEAIPLDQALEEIDRQLGA